MDDKNYCYVYSCDVKQYLTIKIVELEGTRPKPTYEELLKNPVLKYSGRNEDCSDLMVECKIFSDGRDRTESVRAPYKSFTNRWNWNIWLEFPIKYCDLPRNSLLVITIYDHESPGNWETVGGTSIPLFNENAEFQRGVHDLRVWRGEAGDAVKTPGLDENNDKIHELNKKVKQYENGQMQKVSWLDPLTFSKVNKIRDEAKKSSKFMYLTIEFPKPVANDTYYHIVWYEKSTVPDNSSFNKSYENTILYDPDLDQENLHESKHHHLARSLQSGVTDRDLKPNHTDRDLLYKIIQYSPTVQLTSDEQDLVWKYRYFLSNEKNCLTKFLRCVKWNLEKEAEQALPMLQEWAPPDAQDALELLGPDFIHPQIRKYAVERLDSASDDELLLYLLQLVEALKYETWEMKSMNLLDVSHYSLESEYSTDAANFSTDPLSPLKKFPKFKLDEATESKDNLSDQHQSVPPILQTKRLDAQADFLLEGSPFANSGQDLASFLIKRSCRNNILANYLYWYLLIECEPKSPDQGLKPESKVKEMYLWVMNSFKLALQQFSPTSKQTWHSIMRQQRFVDTLVSIMQSVSKETGGRLKKNEKLQSMLADPELNLKDFESFPLPLNPEVQICGIVPEKATLFESALEPCKLTFKTVDGSYYIAIFKCGDDLRQDQLIIQIITLMNQLLLNENMDLKLTPYKVLATSSRHGFVQYIESTSIAEILRTNGSIQNYFRSNAPCESTTHGISPQVMDTYLRSCAGYCIITYILGIGDRHFDNLLLTQEGHFFHIDFGYILGRDPKPLPPPMKLTKEMVDAMGGQSSENYLEFRRLCYTTYVQLRRHAIVFLHLFSLMTDASVPDIANEPDKTTKKIEDKFCLSLEEEEAVSHVKEIIDSSVGAVVAVFVEQFHRFAQYIRK